MGVEIVVPLAFFISVVVGIVGVTRVISDGRTRRRLLESNATPELAAAVVAPPRNEPFLGETLKWGLVAGAVGIALIVIQFLPYEAEDPITSGIVLLAAAVGLLSYYVTGRRLMSDTRPTLPAGGHARIEAR